MVVEGISSGIGMQMPVQSTVQAPKHNAENTDVTAEKNAQNGSVQTNANSTVDKSANEGQAVSEQFTHEQLKKAVETINKKIGNSEAVFGVHEETNRVTIKIIDKDTKETIKELPPEKTLDMIAKVWEMAGILVDEKR